MTQAIIPASATPPNTGGPNATTSASPANSADWSDALAQAGSEAVPVLPAVANAKKVLDSEKPEETRM
jgi:hypothetical protein